MSDETILFRTAEFEIATTQAGSFRVVRLRGQYAPSLLDALRTSVFLDDSDYAVDASGLRGMSLPLARELSYTAKLLRRTDHRMVLLRPPEDLRNLFALLAPGEVLPSALHEDRLPDLPHEGDTGALHASHELERIGRCLRTDPCWQLMDLEGAWLCPFCARPQPDIRIPSIPDVLVATLETMYSHLWTRCPGYSAANPFCRPLEELRKTLREINQDKVVLSRERAKSLETRAARADRLEQTLRSLSEVRRRILPKSPPEVPGLEIGILDRPASGGGGDFYDFVERPDGTLAVLVGSISLAGIEAAILMGVAKTALSLRLEEDLDPREALRRTNRDLHRILDRTVPVSALVAVVVASSRSLRLFNAGHPPAVLHHPERTPRVERIAARGSGLGVVPDDEFSRSLEPREVSLKSGDLLLLHTDGLVKVRNAHGEEFGFARVASVVERLRNPGVPILLSDLSNDLDRFCAGTVPDDAATAVAVKFR